MKRKKPTAGGSSESTDVGSIGENDDGGDDMACPDQEDYGQQLETIGGGITACHQPQDDGTEDRVREDGFVPTTRPQTKATSSVPTTVPLKTTRPPPETTVTPGKEVTNDEVHFTSTDFMTSSRVATVDNEPMAARDGVPVVLLGSIVGGFLLATAILSIIIIHRKRKLKKRFLAAREPGSSADDSNGNLLNHYATSGAIVEGAIPVQDREYATLKEFGQETAIPVPQPFYHKLEAENKANTLVAPGYDASKSDKVSSHNNMGAYDKLNRNDASSPQRGNHGDTNHYQTSNPIRKGYDHLDRDYKKSEVTPNGPEYASTKPDSYRGRHDNENSGTEGPMREQYDHVDRNYRQVEETPNEPGYYATTKPYPYRDRHGKTDPGVDGAMREEYHHVDRNYRKAEELTPNEQGYYASTKPDPYRGRHGNDDSGADGPMREDYDHVDRKFRKPPEIITESEYSTSKPELMSDTAYDLLHRSGPNRGGNKFVDSTKYESLAMGNKPV